MNLIKIFSVDLGLIGKGVEVGVLVFGTELTKDYIIYPLRQTKLVCIEITNVVMRGKEKENEQHYFLFKEVSKPILKLNLIT